MARKTTASEDKRLAECILDAATFSVESRQIDLTIDAKDVLTFVAENFDPEDVYFEEDLHRWAKDNGYTKTE